MAAEDAMCNGGLEVRAVLCLGIQGGAAGAGDGGWWHAGADVRMPDAGRQ